MIGNFMLNQFEVYEAIKTVKPDGEIKKLLLRLSHVTGKGRGMSMVYDYFFDRCEIDEEMQTDINNMAKNYIDTEFHAIVNRIQEILEINDNFFIYDFNEDNIYTYNISYDLVINTNYRVSTDFSKLAIIRE